MRISREACEAMGKYYELPATPTIEGVLADPSASFWLKDALRSGLKRDCVDAAYDAKLLAELLMRECDRALGRV